MPDQANGRSGPAVVRYEEEVASLREAFTGVFQDLVVSARSTPATKRAILPHLPLLAGVLGRKCALPCTDVLR